MIEKRTTGSKQPSDAAMQAARDVFTAYYLLVPYEADVECITTFARALDAFAEAARKDEREACADLVIQIVKAAKGVKNGRWGSRAFELLGIAEKTIRQRGAK